MFRDNAVVSSSRIECPTFRPVKKKATGPFATSGTSRTPVAQWCDVTYLKVKTTAPLPNPKTSQRKTALVCSAPLLRVRAPRIQASLPSRPSEMNFSRFSSVTTCIGCDLTWATTASFHILSNSFITNHPNIWRYSLLPTASLDKP